MQKADGAMTLVTCPAGFTACMDVLTLLTSPDDSPPGAAPA